MSELCRLCPWRGTGGIVIPVHGNTGEKYLLEKVFRPSRDLPDDVFVSLLGLTNFAGSSITMAAQMSSERVQPVTYHYGTAIHTADCIGSSVSP